MFSDERQFFVQKVLPAYETYAKRRSARDFGSGQQLRDGLTLAAELYHLREHLPSGVTHGIFDFHEYCLVRDVTNLAKHCKIDRYKPLVADVVEVQYSVLYSDQDGEYWTNRPEVVLKLSDGTSTLLVEVVDVVMNEWCRRLRDAGILDIPDRKPLTLPVFMTREDAQDHPMETRSGEQLNLTWQFFEHDPATGTLRPFDLKDFTIKFTVRELPKSVTIEFGAVGIPGSFEMAIPLSGNTAHRYARCRTDEERAAVLRGIILQDESLRHQMLERLTAPPTEPA